MSSLHTLSDDHRYMTFAWLRKVSWCRRCVPARILTHLPACLFILFSTKRTTLQFTIGYRHLNVRVWHVDILRKRLPPSNLHWLSKDEELEMGKQKGGKRGKKKMHKTVKAKQNHFYFKEKESLAATSEQQKKHYRI